MKKRFPKGHKPYCGCAWCSNLRGKSLMLGRKHSDETRAKISMAHKGISRRGSGWKVSEETKEKMRQVRKNHKEDCQCAVCKTIRGIHPMKGTKRSKETIEKILLTKKLNGSNKPNSGSFQKGIIPWMKGRRHTEESKEKMSKSLKGKIAWNKGLTKETDERIMKLSISMKNCDAIHGENNHGWKGGVSSFNHLIRNSIEMDDWRKDIFERDDYTCQLCHERGMILRAHHIKSYTDIIGEYNIKSVEDSKNCRELWDISNGITVCDYCHRWIHRVNPINQQ